MITVGAFEAKTHLSALLDKVEAGEEVTITRHGQIIAKLIGQSTAQVRNPKDIIARINTLADKSTIGSSDWKELRDFGRKW